MLAGIVEVWLQRLGEGMQGTVKAIVKRAARNVYEMDLQSFIFSHPAQMALLGIQFQWTADMQVIVCGRTIQSQDYSYCELKHRPGRRRTTGKRCAIMLP